ncbi:MAG: ABC transporter substrate-binding protein [Acidisphaera sp.]|nr:ABC transporter substrate-binding protein [Acidisphaera sp.]
MRGPIGAWLAALTILLAAGAAAAETGVTKDTIKLGMFGPLTGPVAVFGYPINDGAIAIYDKVNDEGGIYGRKIEIIDEDGACDPAKTRAAVKKLISRDQVFAVHGGNCSAAAFATRQEFSDDHVPWMVMAATLDKISAPLDRYVFTTTPPGSTDSAEIIRFIRSMPNVKRVAVVRHTDEWANYKLETIRRELTGPDLQLVADEVLDRNATDATTQVLKIKEAKPDVVLFITYPGESAVFLRDSRKYGLDGPFVGTNATMDLLDLADRAGGFENLKDVYADAFLAGPIGSPEMQGSTDIFKKYFPNEKLQSLSFYGMSGAYTIVDALRRAGPDLTRDKFIAALESTKDLSVGPSYCKVTITPENHQGCLAQHMWTVRDGKIAVVGETWKPPVTQ